MPQPAAISCGPLGWLPTPQKKDFRFVPAAAACGLNMSEWRADFELLQAFSRQGDQPAFATLTRRHLDLVYATALRKVTDGTGAEEICQNVFGALARKAWQFAPDDSLPSWLHRTTLLESKSWLRGELRRRRREETAAALGTTMNTSEAEPAFAALVPLLDEALLSLREKDRTALLLRFYESQSLRNVGIAVGASEDAARMRVQSALEKLAEFFKRRGFKTASVAAAAAALQHTAISTSTAVASTVISTVLQTAPPALVGLGALLARLASMSRAQTAAVCVAVAALPVGWQLNEGRVAGRELNRVETQLVAGQRAAANLESELERLRAAADRLDQSVAQANEAAARATADARAFADWKQRTRNSLLAPDYRWSDDSGFVRIPKAALPELISTTRIQPYASPGVVKPFASELLGLNAGEQEAVEAALRRHFSAVETRLTAGVTESNQPVSGNVLARRSFALSAPADGELMPFMEQILAEVSGLVGEERRRLIEAKPPEAVRVRGASLDVSVRPDDKGGFQVHFSVSYNPMPKYRPKNMYSENLATYHNADLSIFLPDGDPNQTAGIERSIEEKIEYYLPNPARQRILAWLQEQAAARIGRKENP